MFNTSLGHKIIDIYNEKGVSGIKSDGGVIDLLTNNTAENYEREILKHKGDYEYVYGTIWNFEYSLRDDGGFDCVVKIKTVGMSLLDTKVNRERSPSVKSVENESEERKIENTSPDEVSDEFYLMMDNLPEIVYGSLIQGYSRTSKMKGDSVKERSKKASTNFGDGIDSLDAAFYLMGGGEGFSDNYKKTQQFALALLIESVDFGWDYWTKYEPLVSVFQEALIEQGQNLPVYGADGGFGDETLGAMVKFQNDIGSNILIKWVKASIDDDWKKRVDHISKSIFTKGVQDIDPTDDYIATHNPAIQYLRAGKDGKRPKQFNITEVPNSPPYLTATEDPNKIVDNYEDTIPEIESKFYNWSTDVGTPTEKDDKITIFTSYRQSNTTQIFTGFNWEKSKEDFDTLSEKYATEYYRDNLIPIGRKRARAKEKAQPLNKGHSAVIGGISLDITKYPDYWPWKPEWTKLPEEDPDKPFVPGESDEFLEFLDDSVPAKIWIRWGWFEDNILTRYLGYMPDVDTGGSPVSFFKSVEPKINKLGEIITGYESNKIGLPKPLLTTDVKQILIPDRVESLEKVKTYAPHIKDIVDFNFYACLGTFLNSEIKEPDGVGISPVEVPVEGSTDTRENYKVGYIRNLFVEASTLQEAFLNIGTLKEGLDRFIAIMYRNFGKVHKLEVHQGRDDNMVGIVDTNLISDNAIWKNKRKEDIPDSLENEANKIRVFEFPAWEKESIVKSQDLKVTIPDEMAITALYSANEHMRNFGLYDESRGSAEAQKLSKYLRLDTTGKDIAKKSVSNRLTELSPIITSKNLTISGDGENETGKHRYDQTDAFLTLLNKELLRSIGKNPIHAEPIKLEEVTEEDTSASHTLNIQYMKKKFLNGNGYYNNKGTLEEKNPYNMRRIMEYELQYHTNAVQNNYPTINGLLDLSLTIDGTAGIFPGNSYISKYLPKAWQARTTGKGAGEYPILFQATDISHEISSDGWNTMITGMPRMNPKAFPYKYDKPSDDKDFASNTFTAPASTAISDYFNFFNLNFNFANKCLPRQGTDNTHIILRGINTSLWVKDVSGTGNPPPQIGSFKHMGMIDAINKLGCLGTGNSDGVMRGINEEGEVSNYADFSKVMESLDLDSKTVIIPGKKVEQTLARLGVSKIQDDSFFISPQTFASNVELLLFLQMSMIISGLTFYGLNKPISEVVYNEMLADTAFESYRPKILQKPGTSISILVSQKKIGEKVASNEYFQRRWISKKHKSPLDRLTITPYIWQKKNFYGGENESEVNDLPGDILLIGPARFTPPGSRQKGSGGSVLEYYPPNSEIKIFEGIFMTILQNEYGIGTWKEFDVIISKALGTSSPEQSVEDLFQNNPNEGSSVDSEKVFKYALDCEYRIKKPS